MVAAVAGLVVFFLVLSSTVAVVLCLHRHRTHSFKGFTAGSGLNQASTPQRFKLDRPHLLESTQSSPSALVTDDLLLCGSRSKTATLTAAYRMTPRGDAPLIGGTLCSKPYRALQQNAYTPAGSIYGEGAGGFGGGSSSNGSNSGSRPFLVSYASSNLYAEPDYNYVSSGDQLTGSTTVTANSLPALAPCKPAQPPLPCLPFSDSPMAGTVAEDHKSKYRYGEVEVEVGPDRSDTSLAAHHYATYEELNPAGASTCDSKPYSLLAYSREDKAGRARPGLAESYSSQSSNEDADQRASPRSASTQECAESGPRHYPSRPRGKSGALFGECGETPPECDPYYPPRQSPSLLSLSRNRRLASQSAGKYGSLLRQSREPVSAHRYASPNPAPFQLEQSPVSTRLYFNFNDPLHSNPYQGGPFYNSLRANGQGWPMRDYSGRPSGTEREGAKLDHVVFRQSGDHMDPPEYQRIFEEEH